MITHDDVARTLPVGIVDTIEASKPCAGGFDHLWDFYPQTEQTSTPRWKCVYCSTTVTTDPRPVTEQQRPLASANLEDYLR